MPYADDIKQALVDRRLTVACWDRGARSVVHDAIADFSFPAGLLVYPDKLELLHTWRTTHPKPEEGNMQRQYTFELRVDFADKDKEVALKEVLLTFAHKALATAQLLSDIPKTTSAILHGDDFVHPKEEIMLYEGLADGLVDSEAAPLPDAAEVDPYAGIAAAINGK